MTDVRQELRDVEERIARLRAENDALSRSLVKPTRARNWTVTAVLVAAVTATGGYSFADRRASDRAAQEAEVARTKDADELGRLRADTLACQLSSKKLDDELAACRKGVAAPSNPSPTRPPPRPACLCEPGDPLCSCL